MDEIRRMCGNARRLTPMGWHFVYGGRHFCDLAGDKDEATIRFCVPHLVGASACDAGRLAEAVNDTNRHVKYVKVVRLDCGSVALDYDHQAENGESARTLVPHIIRALDFASAYLLRKLRETKDR